MSFDSSISSGDLFARRLGLFVHWGIYAIPGYHEQHQQRLGVPRAEYVKLAAQFNPQAFDADQWALLAKEAGLDYLILTAKHHDGFCLWETEAADFAVRNTPFRRDIVAEVAAACERHGLKFGVYYSCVDWHHPNYPNEGRHHELKGPEPGDRPDLERYLDFVKAQIRELCGGRYGTISAFWWDMNVPEHQDPSLNALIKELQPGCLINNRGYGPGDFSTPEREWDDNRSWQTYEQKVEACNSLDALAWGFRADPEFYTARHLEAAICKYLSRGGNYLINVGPDGSGVIREEYRSRLLEIGSWFRRVRPALAGTGVIEPLPAAAPQVFTRNGNTLYVQIVEPLSSEGLRLKPIELAPRAATLLNTGEPVAFALDCVPSEPDRARTFLRLKLPSRILNSGEVPVVRLEFDSDPFEGRRATELEAAERI